MLEKVISGGQTGVDRAALDAAIELGIPHGGWCPKGRPARDGIIPPKYRLQETTSSTYPPRTRMNVRDSDGTLIYSDPEGNYSRGTALTLRIATEEGKNHLIIRPDMPLPFTSAVDWVLAKNIHILNVAGPSEEGHEGIYKQAYLFLIELFRKTRRV
jgi:hypothetical protein